MNTLLEKIGSLFKSFTKEVYITPSIKIGEIYYLKQCKNNPFKKEIKVKTKDIKNGWVLYTMLPEAGIFDNESMKIEDFLRIYSIK